MSEYVLISCSRLMNIVFRLLFCGGVMFFGISLRAQLTDANAITGRPFSAVKFSSTIHIGRDGKPVTTAEQRRVIVARDEDGRIFMTESGASTSEYCILPGMGTLSVCNEWLVIIFDPNVSLLWHWGVGKMDDKTQYVEFDLNSDQVAVDRRLTSAPPLEPIQESEPGVSMEELGEQGIEGITVRGVRKITFHREDPSNPRVTIHEVWTSVSMGLVLKIVDGDPEGDETISGLDHISLSPAPSLFKLPTERILRRRKWAFFDGDRDHLKNWLVH
jgi:hypothetical protein